MKKDTIRAILVAVIILAIYNLIAFAVPFAHTAAFWISYGFTLVALVVAGGAVYHAVMKDPKIKSRFYGFPIARIGVIYGLIQVAVSLVAMAAGEWNRTSCPGFRWAMKSPTRQKPPRQTGLCLKMWPNFCAATCATTSAACTATGISPG